jgi:hypothetical protein
VALGTFSLVGSTGFGSSSDDSGLAYAADLDVLLHITKQTGSLYSIDKNTASATFLADTGITGSSGFSGLAYGPGPGAAGGGSVAKAEYSTLATASLTSDDQAHIMEVFPVGTGGDPTDSDETLLAEIINPVAAGISCGGTVIDFDDISGTGIRGWNGNRYSGQGVIFSTSPGAGLYAFNATYTDTLPTWVYGSNNGGIRCNDKVIATLTVPADCVSLFVSDVEGPGGGTWNISLFDSTGALLESFSSNQDLQTFQFTYADIKRVEFTPSSDFEGIDTFTFSSTPPQECPTTWDVYLGTDSGAMELIAANLADPCCCPPSVLEDGTTYFWQVIAKNPSVETPGNLWSFETEGGDPPDCSTAVASISEIWPPRHGWVDIEILDVNDPDGDPVTITITGIAQDEPVVGYGSGNTCPDGMGVGTSVASIRSERSGQGNGRIYEISFEADDGTGNSCTGSVNVCVPHDQGQGRECIHDGPLYDSTATELFKADLNNDGIINALDLSILTNYWLVSYELED